ncbi:MAG: hypothetical protein KME12_16440 [Trichocoleus desertorum ATA4-8-CV12]|jgi:hypothetical protein|nr:hypothetical protein [Trichocoleus desertorum ATA4-8-CV12]
MHQKDDSKELVLFDVQTEQGMVMPAQFIEDFKTLSIARVIYQGKLTGQFIEDVRNGKYGVAGGVVYKGGRYRDELWRVKIKTYAYMSNSNKLSRTIGMLIGSSGLGN